MTKYIQLYYLSVVIVINYKYTAAVKHVIRNTEYGKVRGVLEHVHHGKVVEKFLGIPYAQPPVGKLRFEVRLLKFGTFYLVFEIIKYIIFIVLDCNSFTRRYIVKLFIFHNLTHSESVPRIGTIHDDAFFL